MAHSRRLTAAERFAELSRVGTALMGELDEKRLLHMIAKSACRITRAAFAAFTLRPINEEGHPLVPAEGELFRLVAIAGVNAEQEQQLNRMKLGGKGILEPIFHYGVPVRIDDVQKYQDGSPFIYTFPATLAQNTAPCTDTVASPEASNDTSTSNVPAPLELYYQGIPPHHPVIRSFLGVPLLDRKREVRGGLLLGHPKPNHFTEEDESILVGLAAQAAVAIENARLFFLSQKRAQELDMIFESIAEGVIVIDEEGRVIRENDTAQQLREQLEHDKNGAKALDKLIHNPVQRALQGSFQQDMPVTITVAGEERQYTISTSPLRMEHLTLFKINADRLIAGAIIVWHDVTLSHNIMLERREREEVVAQLIMFKKILNALPSAVYLVQGKDARMVLGNEQVTGIWGAEWRQGQPLEEFLHQNNIQVFDVEGRLLEKEQLVTWQIVNTGIISGYRQAVIRQVDGTHIPVMTNGILLNAEDTQVTPQLFKRLNDPTAPEPLGLIVIQDVSALKETERIKDDFLSIAAHELRTPLAILMGFAQTLLVQTARGKGGELAGWQIEALQGIEHAGQRMTENVSDLLDVTRLQAGRLELIREPTDLITMARRVAKRLQVTTHTHTLLVHTDQEYVIVEADSRRTEQVLGNLLNNAIKYTPQGGPIDVMVTQDMEKKEAVVSVQDHGIGIPEHQHAQMFGRFMRADNAHDFRGTGLGLYLCRELIERQGGNIWFSSVEGEGSTFFFTLPLISDENKLF